MKNSKTEVMPVEDFNFWTYRIPTYKVTNDGIEDGEGIILKLCRGNKADENVPRQEGVFSESLLEAVRQYLTSQNTGELSNPYTTMAIEAIKDAQDALGTRAAERKARGVQGTYKP